MSESLSALLYLVASICFIMALRGLSSPETARGGTIFGIVGMVLAILTTLASPEVGRMLCDELGWSERAHARWLADALARTLLAEDDR